jgi:NAD(P)H-dependent FMN reductase
MHRLQVIVASTRPGRLGPSVAAWFQEVARGHGRFEVELVDLAEVNLPMFDEPQHPAKGLYAHEHTRRWAARIATGDAFVIVTPEYNHAPPPSLVNALDFIFAEWNHKPVAFVSYGAVSGGTRAVEAAHNQVIALKMVPLAETVAIPWVSKQIADGKFNATEAQNKSASSLLDALLKMSEALKPTRPTR